MIPISILELARTTDQTTVKQALDRARDVAVQAEAFGFHRVWVAEHHNMSSICSAATSLVISHIAAATKTIRVGAGGIMLPNHAPYIIAEQFGTLEHLYPGRIDLGLGRAPGTDQQTIQAMKRSPQASDRFPQEVIELQSYLAPSRGEKTIHAYPGEGTNVPLWILGSSTFGAALAAELGLPYAFASHFAPELLLTSLDIYRSRFKPSAQLKKPYAMAGLNVVAAETDAMAKKIFTSQQMSFANMFRGLRVPMQAPIEDIDSYWSPQEKYHASKMLSRAVVGSKETVRAGIKGFIGETQVDEVIVVADAYRFEDRVNTLKIISEFFQE